MNAIWLVAKHFSDLRRREAKNIGVLVFVPGNVLYRFVGQRPDGEIDGRSARFAGSGDMYKAWVGFWTRTATEGGEDLIPRLLGEVAPDQSYFLEFGGERLHGEADPDELLHSLYETLVESLDQTDQTHSAFDLSEQILDELPLQRECLSSNFELQIPAEDAPQDSVIFDFRYDNGRVNLMRTVTLSFSDKRSWENVHSAAWDFTQAEKHPVADGQQTIALLKSRADDVALRHQLALLRSASSAVIDVGETEVAVPELGGLLGVGAE